MSYCIKGSAGKSALSLNSAILFSIFFIRQYFFFAVLLFIIGGSAAASLPIKVTVTGYVTNGILISEITDIDTHSVEARYEMQPVDRDMKRVDLTSYEGMCVSVIGHLLPGDRFIIEPGSIRIIHADNAQEISKQIKHSIIAFVRQKALWTADSDGSGAKRVISADSETTSAISPDRHWIVYHSGSDPMTGFGRLYRVPISGGRPEELNIKGFSGGQHPDFSSDGRSIVFVGMSDVKARKIKGFDAVYATMSVVVLDLQTGITKIIVSQKNVLLDAGYVFSHPSFSPDGRLIAYQHSGSDVSGGFSVIDLTGKTIFNFPKSGSDPLPYWRPQFSPDGKQILCYSPAISEDTIDTIFMIDMKTGLKQRITEGANPVLVDNGRAAIFERWVNKWKFEGDARADLWYLELKEGAKPKKIIENATHPSG